MKNETSVPEQDAVSVELLHAGLAGLPEKYRVPLLLHHLEGRTQEETAALMGCSLAAVTARLHRGRQMLRERLAQNGVLASGSSVAFALGAHTAAAAPASFVTLAGKAAAAVAAHQLASVSSLSGPTLALSKGALKMLYWNKVKRMAACAIALLLVAGVGTYITVARAAATTTQAGEIPATGRITSIAGNTVTITSRNGTAVAFTVDDATTITLDGNAAKLTDLQLAMPAAAFIPVGKSARAVQAITPKP